MFTTDAIDKLYEGSKGIPRLINILSHKTLMVAYGKGDRIITGQYLDLAINDTEVSKSRKSLIQRLFAG